MWILGVLGKLLISMGVGVLLFVGWTLKGTDFYTEQQQQELAQQFDQAPAIELNTKRSGVFKGPGDAYAPDPGQPVFRLRIPKIEKSVMVVEGVGTDELKLGPGHYPSCRDGFSEPLCTELDEVWPGERGRVIVSGHRTTYDAPFWSLDRLSKGDDIITETKWGRFTYEVTDKEIVPANSTDIANPAASNTAEIALTTCNPRFSAAQRLIVYGEMRIPA